MAFMRAMYASNGAWKPRTHWIVLSSSFRYTCELLPTGLITCTEMLPCATLVITAHGCPILVEIPVLDPVLHELAHDHCAL